MSISRSHPVPPKPETTRAILMSDGCGHPTPTVHFYEETRAVVLPGPDGHAWEFLYRCAKTGAVRRWGVVERTVPVGFDGAGDQADQADQEVN